MATAGELKETAIPYNVNASGHASNNRNAQSVEDQGWIDFREQCRRQMDRPLALRIKYGFLRPIQPVGDRERGRSFKTMAEYRSWCEKNLPDYLGFKRSPK